MNKTHLLFGITVTIILGLVTSSCLFYQEFTRITHYRAILSSAGHDLIELRDQITQHALESDSDPYFITEPIVTMEQDFEDLLKQYQSEAKSTYGIYDMEMFHIISRFSQDALKMTDALDHIVGLIIVKETILRSLIDNLHGIDHQSYGSAQKHLLKRALESSQLQPTEQSELTPIINTYKNIDAQKHHLFNLILSHEHSKFVEHSENTLTNLANKARIHVIQSAVAIIIMLAFFITMLYVLRIKELNRNNIAFRESIARAEQANHAKSLFLATMSHELRTPMNGVLGLAQVIREGSTDSEAREHASVIVDSGQHLVTLLNDILDFSKIEEGKMVLENTDFHIEDTIQHMINTLTPLAKEKSISLTVSHSVDKNLRLIGDSARLRQIIFNLAGNAIKFTKEGQVTVAISLEYSPQTSLVIEIRDTGIGIKRDKLENIFTPFEQADLSTTRKFGGTGLGLAIVKQLTDLMGGDIQVFSQPGVGTKFALCLPIGVERILVNPIETTKKLKPSLLNRDAPLSILLVEDNHVNAIVAKSFLSSCGHNTEWVNDGMTAIERASKERFDLIIMDNHMPQLSGVETIKRLRQQLNLNTAIFAYTADVFKEAHDDFIRAGADFVLTKPLQKENLEKAIIQFKAKIFQQPSNDELSAIRGDTVSLIRPALKHLPLTEEELTQSPLLNDSELSEEQKNMLLQTLNTDFEEKSFKLIKAYGDKNCEALHHLLHSIKGMALEFNMMNLSCLAETSEQLARKEKLPEVTTLQKLINLMIVNCHQTQRILDRSETKKQIG